MRCAEGSAGFAACRAVVRAGLALRKWRPERGSAVLFFGSVRGSVSRWSLWDLPRRPQVLAVSVIAVYCAAACTAVAVTSVRSGQLRLFGLLVLCAGSVELTRGSGPTKEVMWGVYAIWDLPCAVLLPPTYVLLAPVARMALTGTRVGKAALHRRAYTAATVGLAYAAASVVFHAAVPVLGPNAGTGTGERAMLWTLLAAGCGLLRLVVNGGLVLAAVKGLDPSTRVRTEIAGAEAIYGSAAELALSLLVTVAAARAGLTVLYALPLAIPLQRSLRHAQLVAEARVDGKSGLLNDRTWRHRAEDEVARAVRTRTQVAVGILDIDRFKRVNDTFGHLAGDAVLAAVAASVRATLRGYDVIGRTGGEEFAFILPGAPAAEAAEVGERLRRAIAELQLPPGLGPTRVTVSVGIAVTARPDRELISYYGLADAALYAAKQHGRDAVWIVEAGPEADGEPRPSGSVRVRAAS
jgi:diguanylate cyclase (GGDEF)-like protein